MISILSILVESIIKIIIELVKLIFSFAAQGSRSLFSNRERPLDAKFARPNQLFSKRGKGMCLTGNPKQRLDLVENYRNCLIIGGSGVGKSACTIIPSQLLCAQHVSTITHDPSCEIAEKVAGHLHQLGVEKRIINFEDYVYSDGYNPLQRINSPSDIAPIAKALVTAGLGAKSAGADSFWNSSAESLISTLISIVLTQDAKYRNLANVARLVNILSSDPAKIDNLFAKNASPALFDEYKSYIALPEKVGGSVLATAKTALQIFTHESVALVTSHDTIDFASLRRKKSALFIQNSIMSLSFMAPLTSMFFHQLFQSLLGSLPTDADLPILILVDEASSFRFEDWPLVLSNVRKWKIGVTLALQERYQLENLYGTYGAQTIESNCYSKMYFTNQSLPTARALSELLGKFEYLDDKNHKQVRQLLTAQEIRQLPADSALVLLGNHAPAIVNLQPYYNSPLRKMVNLPAPPRESKLPWTSVPMLPL